jgi:hypothetical protein
VAEARDPVLGHERRVAKHRFGDSRPPEALDLGVTADFLDPEGRGGASCAAAMLGRAGIPAMLIDPPRR